MKWRSLSWKVLTAGRGRRILLAAVILALVLAGVLLRQSTWEETTHLRFQRDIVNGFYWGSQTVALGQRLSPGEKPDSWRALVRGYLALYDQVGDDAYDGNYGLDYPPLRLLVMSIWAKEVRAKFPGVEDGTPDYVRPLLHVNLLCEMVTAAGIFLLVRRGLRRASGATADSPLFRRLPPRRRATICGLMAASVVWFDPSLILDTHAWPQWDVWILPFFLFAALAALTRRWFWCGCLLAAGGMLKGQLLLVAPFFLFWPLWQRRWVRASRLLAGFAFSSALLVLPWLLRNASSWCLVTTVAGLAAAVLFWLDARNAGAWTAGITAVAAFIVGAVNGGSFGWLTIGFLYGSEHYPYLFISSCYNLPSLLADWGWSLKAPLWTINRALDITLTLQWALRLFYLGALVLCGLAAARHARYRDPRLLIALAAPWLLMFALLAQMHERYLLWGAVLSAVALGVSLRLSVLHFLFSAMSAAMIAQVLLVDKKLGPTLGLIDLLERLRPYASWVLLGCVAIWVWDALPSRLLNFSLRSAPSPPKGKVALALAPVVDEV